MLDAVSKHHLMEDLTTSLADKPVAHFVLTMHTYIYIYIDDPHLYSWETYDSSTSFLRALARG